MKCRKKKVFLQNPWHPHKEHFGIAKIKKKMNKTMVGYVKMIVYNVLQKGHGKGHKDIKCNNKKVCHSGVWK